MNWYQSGVVLTLAAFGALGFACTSSVNEDIVISGTGNQTPTFDVPDASPPRADGGGVCPSNECPPGHATCPNAPFLCSVDLSSDDDNCGECGNRCFDASKPENQDSVWAGLHAKFVCVDSSCQFGCASLWADCNGYAEDGCEAFLFDKEHCGACNKACQENERCDQGTCVCDISDSCGKCGNTCPEPEAPPFPYEWNAGFFCQGDKCNQPGCSPGFDDCNHDFDAVNRTGDGCETSIQFNNDNCQECGKKCAPGEVCTFFGCVCACGSDCFGDKINTDPHNCGACGVECISSAINTKPFCDRGVCQTYCMTNWGDCDELAGCETNLSSDPLNCGACGVRCDAIEGQACVDGRCTTKECTVQ